MYTRVAFAGEAPLTFAIGQELGATLVLLPIALFRVPSHVPSWHVTGAIVALAVLATSLAFLIYFHLISRIGPTRTLSVTFLAPVFGLIWAAIFLHESLSWNWLAGLVVILISMWCVTDISLKRSKKPDVAPLPD